MQQCLRAVFEIVRSPAYLKTVDSNARLYMAHIDHLQLTTTVVSVEISPGFTLQLY